MLSKVQKDFIKNKVKALGSEANVKEFYNRKSLVSEYAHKMAAKLYKEKK